MYIINVPHVEIVDWKAWREPWKDRSFIDHLQECYPEVQSIRWSLTGVEFTFESDEYYHWFLLKQ